MTTDTQRRSPLAMDPEEFRRVGHDLVDRLAAALAAIPGGPVTPHEPPAAVRRALGLDAGLPEHGTAAATLFPELVGPLFEHSLFNGHPRFFGYITAPPAPIGMLGDLVASALNPNLGSWALAPAATALEEQTIRWIAEFIRFGPCNGLFVSGGNMANFVAFWTARAAKAPWPIRTTGLAAKDAVPLRVYASAETHTWIQKAADLSGLGTDAIRWVPIDAGQRMDVTELRRMIGEDRAAGARPFLVVGTAGSVSTGAIDPLPEIAVVCREHDLWFHVDGAYGGFAAALPDGPPALRAIALADSIAVDPHKWLYAPLEAGSVLVRDPDALRAAFVYHPPYYHFDEQATNFVELGPQNSRGFRALKVWLALRQAGAAGYRASIAEDVRLSELLAGLVGAHAGLELITQSLSITTFRFVPPDLKTRAGKPETARYLNELNTALLARIQAGGELFVSNAVVDGRYVLRACIVNFHTSERDVRAVPAIVARIGRAIDEERRVRQFGDK